MIGVLDLLYDIDLRLNKVATSSHQHINLEDKIIALNEAQLILIKKIVSGHLIGEGLDTSKSTYDALQTLIVPHVSISAIEESKTPPVSYYCELSALPSKYMYFVDAYFTCSKGACANRHVRGFRIKHADLQPILNNQNTCPSFEYQETPATVTAERIYGYTDGTFIINNCHVSYIRYPQKIDMEGYIDFDGTPSANSDCELPLLLKNELVDIAVQQLAMNTENTPAVQYAGQRIQQQ